MRRPTAWRPSPERPVVSLTSSEHLTDEDRLELERKARAWPSHRGDQITAPPVTPCADTGHLYDRDGRCIYGCET